MRQWRLIVDKPMNGAANMATDEAILHAVAEGDAPPTLRLYAWEPFCLSLGYGQRARDTDLDGLIEHGWDLVRRPTGGRAILHGDELTYSVALPEDHPLAKGGIIETYLRLSSALLNAMERLGLGVSADAEGESIRDAGPVCFEVPSKYEITFDEKKLIGSAQMRRHSGVLQHGTIPLYGDIARICDALAYETDTARNIAKQDVRRRAATLADAGLENTEWHDIANALIGAFTETLDLTLEAGEMNEKEHTLADTLYRTVYTTDDWNFKR